MGRPRKYVQTNGKEITGVSKMPDGRFYIIDNNNRRRYFRKVEDARAAYLATQSRDLSPMERAVLIAKAEIRRAAAHEKLKRSGMHDELGNRIVTGPPEPIVVRNDDSILFKYLETANSLADTVGVPEVDVRRVNPSVSSAGSAPKLSRVIDEWRRLKKTGRGDKDTRHVKEATRIFKQFIRVIGNNPIDGLNASQFAAWREWVLNAAVKRASGKWSNDRHAIVKQVIRFVRRHRSDWPWPDGLSDWLDAYDRKAYLPSAANKQPLPPEVFRQLLTAAEKWAQTDPSASNADTQQGRGQRRQAQIKIHNGLQMRAILMLGVNCGLDPIDFSRIQREHIKLDGEAPHLDLPRSKVEHRVGAAVDRRTPLLPSTVEVVREVLAMAPSSGPVFRTARGSPFTAVTKNFRRLAGELGVEERWSFKHLRNVGPTLGKKAKLSKDERDAFLGHVVNGTSAFYEGDVDETYLVDLVNLIGKHYFDGERVESTATAR